MVKIIASYSVYYCFQNLLNKCGTIFGRAQETAGTSANQGPSSRHCSFSTNCLNPDYANQGPSSSTAIDAINSSFNTIRSQDKGLPNSAAPRQPQMQQDVASRGQDKGTRGLFINDGDWSSIASFLIRDEDVCPTCLEEYTPRIRRSHKMFSSLSTSVVYMSGRREKRKMSVCGKLMEFEAN
ncbi:hypothetical protein HAX54_020635 [Datura stramonium]|uniref:Uncharacterized protein n=1 Tax=Datura stramonium TaxID=4076 RepID=A0ABS8S3E7_DATST|nr:hypothetical protein [Datura stramonium]